MNIVFVSSLFPPKYHGGAEILTQIVAHELAKRGHRVTVYTNGNNTSVTRGNLTIKHIPELVIVGPLRTSLSSIYTRYLRQRLLNEQEIRSADIIHAVDQWSISGLAGWEEIQKRLVVTIQDYGLLCPAGDYLCKGKTCANYCHAGKGYQCLDAVQNPLVRLKKQFSYSVRQRVYDPVLLQLQHVICVSKFITREVKKVNKQLSPSIIGNCVLDEWFKQNIRIKKDIDLLYVGQLKPHKGVEVLLSSVYEMQKYCSTRVVLIGGGYINYYRRMARRLGISGKVIFEGTIEYSRIIRYYQRAKIVVSPSVWPEPCGRTIIEAMACGVPVVGTNVGGTPELMTEGKHGFLVEPNVATELARACVTLLKRDSTRLRMGALARQYAKRRYAVIPIMEQYEAVYHSIAG